MDLVRGAPVLDRLIRPWVARFSEVRFVKFRHLRSVGRGENEHAPRGQQLVCKVEIARLAVVFQVLDDLNRNDHIVSPWWQGNAEEIRANEGSLRTCLFGEAYTRPAEVNAHDPTEFAQVRLEDAASASKVHDP
jgi:hypothetical protein